jgi:eukaryotic-like serine/threonine-protein kinase
MGSRILAGRYELLEKIGEGGMAVVFKARDRLLNRHVAIKILKPEFTKDMVFIESFRRESQTAAGLVHPNIVNVYDVGKEGNIYYIVMELIDGKPLSEVIKEDGALDPRRAATITRQIASALATAHKHQLIHRDVKPHNIMLTAEGVAKITDFGIAKAISTGTLVGAKQEAVMGSVHYFSPEQARGGYVDEKSDLYSLGIVLYEMLTGKVPFDGDTAVAVAVKHMNEAMVPPSKVNGDVPADLEEIVMKATSKLQINRYKNADEMITALSFVKYSKPAAGLPQDMARHGAAGAEGLSMLSKEEASQEEEKTGRHVSSGGGKGNGKSKGKKRVIFHPEKLGVIILALALAVPVSGLIYKAIMGAGAEKEIKVPDIVGMTQEQAVEILSPSGLILEVDMELPSNIYAEGEIISQAPKAEAVVKSGGIIRVNISKGEVDGTVPGVEGKPLSGAKYILETYGYKTGTVTEANSDAVPAGIVLSQNPEKGTVLADGGSVNLVVSLGPEFGEFAVIDLRGMTLEQATSSIESMGLVLGAVTYVENASVEENCVISHSPGPGTTVTEPIEVDLVVSKVSGNVNPPDPEDPPESNTIEITLDFSLAQNDEFLLTVNVADGVTDPRTPISKQPRIKDDESEVIRITGSGENGTVKIWYDNELIYDLAVDFTTGAIN